MIKMISFKSSLAGLIFALVFLAIPFSHAAEIYISPLAVNIGESFSFYMTVKNAENVKSFRIDLHLPLEVINTVSAIDPPSEQYESFQQTSHYDETLKSVVWSISGTFLKPMSGSVILFKVSAAASNTAGYSSIGVAVKSGELTGSFVHGGSIYILDPNWPSLDVQMNYRNAFNRMDYDNSGRVDKQDLFFLISSWHQQFSTDLPVSPDPTPTPVPGQIPSIQEFIGTWTFEYHYYAQIAQKNVLMVFDAIMNEDGFILLQGQHATKFLGTYTYDTATGKISGVFMNPYVNTLNPLETIDYFVNFEGIAGAGNTIMGTATVTYNSMDFLISGYENFGLTLTDSGTFTAAKKQ